MASVGVRELRDRLSEYLRRVKAGERLVVTERGRPVALLSPPLETPADHRLEALLREGVGRWGGGKPRGAARPVKVRGPSVADAVIEDRR